MTQPIFVRLVVVAVVTMFAQSVFAASEYYTWIDEDGVTNYAERNPAGYEAEHVTRAHRFGLRMQDSPVAVAPPPQDEEASSDEAGTDVDPQELIAAERQQYEQALAEERAFNCNVGKQNLARLSTFARVRIKDANGEERVMTENEMNNKKKESEDLIRKNCSG